MKRAAWAAAAALLALARPAWADTLLDNIDGTAFDAEGKIIHFSALLIDREGRIAQVFARQDKRPKKPDYLIDGRGRFVLPGLIDSHVRLMPLALADLAAQAPADSRPLPPPRPEDRDVAFGKLQRQLAARGITAVADMGTTIEDWQTYRRAGDNGTLYLRIMAYAADIPALALTAGPRPTPWLYDDRLRMNGLHIALDGPLEAGKAALKAAPGTRQALDDTQLRNVMSRASMDGFQIAISAHGDAAVASALGAITELALTYTGERRWRIGQVDMADPADLAELATRGVLVSASPLRLGAQTLVAPDQASRVQPWRALLQAGVKLSFATAGQPPLAAMAAAISREDAAGNPPGGWQAQERLAREQALAAFTTDGAHAGWAGGRFGRLAVGERADFIMVASDPLLSPPAELRQMPVLETWIGGRKIYDAVTAAPGGTAPAQLPQPLLSPPASR